MKVFISWSGAASQELAFALRDWLPYVVQAIEPWVSQEDIAKGSVWFSSIRTELSTSAFGLCCLTPENLKSPWMAFETGALVASQGIGKEGVSPILLGVKAADVVGPYDQLQATELTLTDVQRLLTSMNAKQPEKQRLAADRLKEITETYWPKLELRLRAIRPLLSAVAIASVERTETEVLEDLVRTTRQTAQAVEAVAGGLQSLSHFVSAQFMARAGSHAFSARSIANIGAASLDEFGPLFSFSNQPHPVSILDDPSRTVRLNEILRAGTPATPIMVNDTPLPPKK